jgi:ABC-2 type transport system permease protein
MKDLFIVTKFTMKDMLQRKSFIITTIIFLIMIVVGFNIPNFMKMLNKDSDVNKIEIIDSGNVFEGTLESLKDLDTGYEIQILNEDYEKIKEKIENEEIDSAIIVEKQDENIKIKYIVKSATMMSGVPENIFQH